MNLGHPDYKSRAPITRPHCLPNDPFVTRVTLSIVLKNILGCEVFPDVNVNKEKFNIKIKLKESEDIEVCCSSVSFVISRICAASRKSIMN